MISLYLAPSERERRLAGRNHSLWLIVFLKVGNLVQGTREEGSIAGIVVRYLYYSNCIWWYW